MENRGIPKDIQPIVGFLAISGLVCFCLENVNKLVARDEIPDKMGTSQSMLNFLKSG